MDLKIKLNNFFFFFMFLVLCTLYLFLDFEKKIFLFDPFVFNYLRLPRLLLGILAGSGLSLVGSLYQGLFKNPLAEPYLLGVSAGSAFGAVISFYFELHRIVFWGYYILLFNSFISGLGTVYLIFFISQYRKNLNLMHLLLTGVIINTFLFSLEYIFISFSMGKMQNVLLWLWGRLPITEYSVILILGIIIVISSFFIIMQFKSVNLLSISSDFLVSKGINLKRSTVSLFILSTLIIAALTSVCGMIGFVGLIVPHLVRLFVGQDFKKIFLSSLIIGPLFLLGADFLSRLIFFPKEIPLGMVTTLVGAPLFFYLLRRER